jgi:hypothetical protein
MTRFGCRGSVRYRVVALALAAVAVSVFMNSCRSKIPADVTLGAADEAAGTVGIEAEPQDLVITATLLPGRKDIEKRFETYLPDSGIVPVEITVKNNSDMTICLRAANGMPLPEIYNGFILEHGDKRFPLLSPSQALSLMMAEGKSLEYRKPGIFDAVVGIAFPPSLFYYGYKEVSIGRFYRAMYKNSLYPPRKSGILEPLRLGPGDEAKGFLYFFVLPEDSPYPTGADAAAAGSSSGPQGVDRAKGTPCILVRPTMPLEAADTLGIRDAVLARVERPAGSGSRCGGGAQVVFALGLAGKWEHGDVLAGHLDDMLVRGGESAFAVSSYSSKKSRIADASACGGRAACAVNFKSSSTVCLVDLEGNPWIGTSHDLDRRCSRVILIGSGFITMTEDGECRFTRFGETLPARTMRMGTKSQDLYLDGDRLVVLSEEDITLCGASGDDLLKRYERLPLARARRRMIGREGSVFYIIHETSRVGGDTLAVYDAETFDELWRTPLPGRIEFAGIERGLLLQIEDGTILHMSRDAGADSLRIDAAGYAPAPAGAISYRDDGFIVMGKNGVISEGDQVPRAIDDLVTRVPVILPESPTASRLREGR